MPLTRAASQHNVTVHLEGTAAILTIQGCLDAVLGELVLKTATAAVGDAASRVDIDLRSLTGFTPEGAEALVACRALCDDLADGLHYRTGQGPGREALLAAYADED